MIPLFAHASYKPAILNRDPSNTQDDRKERSLPPEFPIDSPGLFNAYRDPSHTLDDRKERSRPPEFPIDSPGLFNAYRDPSHTPDDWKERSLPPEFPIDSLGQSMLKEILRALRMTGRRDQVI